MITKTKHDDGLKWLREIRRKMAEGFGHDPKKAADYIYAALRKGYGQALSALLNTPTPDPDFARGLQQHLVKDGFFKGPVNGSFGTVTKTAMKAAFGTDKG